MNPEILLLTRLAVVEGLEGKERRRYQEARIMKNELEQSLNEFLAKAVTEKENELADLGIKKTIHETLPTILPQLVKEAGESIFTFLTQLFDAPLSRRANSVKRKYFRILSRAACELSISGGNEAAFDALHHGLSRAEDALESGEEDRFRALVRRAFDNAFQANWTAEEFLCLDNEIKKQERLMEFYRTIRRSIGPEGLRRIRQMRVSKLLSRRELSDLSGPALVEHNRARLRGERKPPASFPESRQRDMSPADKKFYT
jgi:hypothetical protein